MGKAACTSSLYASWAANRLPAIGLQAYPCCTIHGALESGFVASSFVDFFSRFAVFFSFIFWALYQLTPIV